MSEVQSNIVEIKSNFITKLNKECVEICESKFKVYFEEDQHYAAFCIFVAYLIIGVDVIRITKSNT